MSDENTISDLMKSVFVTRAPHEERVEIDERWERGSQAKIRKKETKK